MKWDIWAEGYAASGDSAGASLHGRDVEAPTFRDACIRTFGTDPLFNADKLTYWGCKLFADRHEAQRSFG